MPEIKEMTEEEWNKKWPMGKIHPGIRQVAAAWGDAMHLFIRDTVKLAQDMLEATEKYRLEYAEQEVVAFDAWKNKGWERLYDDVYQGIYSGEKKTTKEIYNLYKQSVK